MKNVMKKVLAPTLASVMALSMSATAFAATSDTGTYAYPTETASTAVTYRVEPSYTVTIPATVTLGSTATIKVENLLMEFGGQGFHVSLSEATLDANGDFAVKCDEEALTYTITNPNAPDPASEGKYRSGDNPVQVGDDILFILTRPNEEDVTNGIPASVYSTDLTFSDPIGTPVSAGEYNGTLTFTIKIMS